MKISINWIKDYVDLTGIDVHELAYKFTMSTAEVEDVYTKGEEVKNVVGNAYGKCSIEDMIRREIKDSSLWSNSTFSKEVIAECAKQLSQKIDLKINR